MSSKKTGGLAFVISGPSGSGKTTLVKKLLQRKDLKGILIKSLSFTTRSPRVGEKNGRDYCFISEREFKLKDSRGEFLERTKYLDSYYATSKKFIEKRLSDNKNIVFLIDIKGAFKVKKIFPRNVVLIFILPPSLEILKRRLQGRSSEDTDNFRKRLNIAKSEIKLAAKYDYVAVNSDLKTAVGRLASIIRRELKKRRLVQ